MRKLWLSRVHDPSSKKKPTLLFRLKTLDARVSVLGTILVNTAIDIGGFDAEIVNRRG